MRLLSADKYNNRQQYSLFILLITQRWDDVFKMYLFMITVYKFSLLVPETATDSRCQIRKCVKDVLWSDSVFSYCGFIMSSVVLTMKRKS